MSEVVSSVRYFVRAIHKQNDKKVSIQTNIDERMLAGVISKLIAQGFYIVEACPFRIEESITDEENKP